MCYDVTHVLIKSVLEIFNISYHAFRTVYSPNLMIIMKSPPGLDFHVSMIDLIIFQIQRDLLFSFFLNKILLAP